MWICASDAHRHSAPESRLCGKACDQRMYLRHRLLCKRHTGRPYGQERLPGGHCCGWLGPDAPGTLVSAQGKSSELSAGGRKGEAFVLSRLHGVVLPPGQCSPPHSLEHVWGTRGLYSEFIGEEALLDVSGQSSEELPSGGGRTQG